MGFDGKYDRTTGWGASETPKAARGHRKTYLLKRQEREKPEVNWVKPFEGNQATENGNQLEPWILTRGSELTGVVITDTDPETLQHPGRDYIFATVDGLGIDPVTHEKCVVEAKLVGFGPHMDWGTSGTDRCEDYNADKDEGWEGLPYQVAGQVTTQMSCHNVTVAWIFASIGSDVKCFRVERDFEFEGELLDSCFMMWQKVIAREDPPPGPEPEVRGYYSKKWQETNENTLQAEEACDLIAAREGFRLAEKEAKDQKASVENVLRILIAENDGVECSVGKATNRFNKSGSRTLRVTLNKGVEI
jgi:hypothetical protein